MKSAIDARLSYDNAMRNLIANGFAVGNYKATQSYLRLEQPVIAGRTNYDFKVLVNDNQPQVYNTEVRLNQQDTFAIAEIFAYILNPSSATDATKLPLTYANPVSLNDADALPFQVFYSGRLQFSSMNNILLTAWDVMRNYYAPQTQATADPGDASPLDEKDLSTDGSYPMEPNITLVGSKNNKIELLLPEGVSSLGANTFARFGLILRGILVQNSTIVN